MLLPIIGIILSNCLFFILHVTSTGSFLRPLSRKEEKEQLELLTKGDKSARKKLIEHNLRLVAHIIKKYYSNVNDQDDLVSIGTIGLIKAIDTFDVAKEIRLSSYAAKCIENEILMFFRNNRKISQDISLNEPIDTDKDGNALTLMDIMSTDDEIVDNLDIKFKSEELYKYIDETLSNRENTVIKLRYGIMGNVPLTQREVAKKLNISRSYVSRIEKKALLTLKEMFTKKT